MFFGLQIKGENGWMMMECKNRKESPKPRLDEWRSLLKKAKRRKTRQKTTRLTRRQNATSCLSRILHKAGGKRLFSASFLLFFIKMLINVHKGGRYNVTATMCQHILFRLFVLFIFSHNVVKL